jgi:RNA-directed DNA polymerase
MQFNLPMFDEIGLGEELPVQNRFGEASLRKIFAEKIARTSATGKDGIRMAAFEADLASNLATIERKVLAGTYKFTTYKERLLIKAAGKFPRQISIPTIRDRIVLRAVCSILHDTVPNSTGFSPHAIVDKVAKAIRNGNEDRALIRIDVADFFPSIRHDLLAKELTGFEVDDLTKDLCMKAVRTPSGMKGAASDRGVPQGLSISGALASIYMLRFDDRMLKRHRHYFRYVDDILIICDASEAEQTLASVRLALARIGLKAHPEGTAGKTEISEVSNGIDYLGYHITSRIVSVRDSSFRRMFKNILKVVTDYRYRRDDERLIFRLNLKITGCLTDNKRRGWMMFFSRTENMLQLSHLDSFVKQQLLRVGFPLNRHNEIKRFIRSYHQICFNLEKSEYIPNFEEFTLEQKTQVVAILLRRELAVVKTYDVETIEREFIRLIGQEVHDLEDDVGSPS